MLLSTEITTFIITPNGEISRNIVETNSANGHAPATTFSLISPFLSQNAGLTNPTKHAINIKQTTSWINPLRLDDMKI